MTLKDFLSDVEGVTHACFDGVSASARWAPPGLSVLLGSGGFLRSRFAFRLWRAVGERVPGAEMVAICAAAEILHTATLVHDDVVDQAERRRHGPSVWAQTGIGSAVLLGDVLLTEAMIQIHRASPALLEEFLATMREIGLSELKAEMGVRPVSVSWAKWTAHNRAKTGALFAFLARACVVGVPDLQAALREAGYRIGATYQALDDVVDARGSEAATGKPSGVDSARGFSTPATEEPLICLETVLSEMPSISAGLDRWPAVGRAVAGFLDEDVMSRLRKGVENSEPVTALIDRVTGSVPAE